MQPEPKFKVGDEIEFITDLGTWRPGSIEGVHTGYFGLYYTIRTARGLVGSAYENKLRAKE